MSFCDTKLTLLRGKSLLPQDLFDICLGVLLGDASLQKNKSKSLVKHRIKFLQGCLHKHEKYLWHLYDCFSNFVGAKPYKNEKRKTLAFCTLFNTQFNCLTSIFFEKGPKKSIGTYFQREKLSPRTLAYWFMDDGGLLSYNKDYPRRALVFNCQGFTEKECFILRDNLNKNYNLKSRCKVEKNTKLGYLIVVPASRSDYLRSVMDPYIIDSMKHKLRVLQKPKKKTT